MRDAVDTLIGNLLSGPRPASAEAWHRFGDHDRPQHYCPLFATLAMCSDCCGHFAGDLFGQSNEPQAFVDGYTRFRLTAPREATQREFKRIAKYACRLCPNNPLRS